MLKQEVKGTPLTITHAGDRGGETIWRMTAEFRAADLQVIVPAAEWDNVEVVVRPKRRPSALAGVDMAAKDEPFRRELKLAASPACPQPTESPACCVPMRDGDACPGGGFYLSAETTGELIAAPAEPEPPARSWRDLPAMF
jgi:hypothetical protein